MHIQIENLKAWMRGEDLNIYQKADALIEFNRLIDHVDNLEKLCEKAYFIHTADDLPIVHESGHWDGKRSDDVLIKVAEDEHGFHTKLKVGRLYAGVLDGQAFADWYDNEDNGPLSVISWAKIPR